ncbi:MAG: Uma2 family endonuclease [Stigonema ocellatum SAG 48.90 = DSM 106950]|nr:Uma2 family endonuclease [Stigonema ocellatum SAG 48.90 = DSM 106950]
MRQPIENLTTFDEFVDFLQTKPENIRYELYDGEIVQMPLPTGEHEEIVTFLVMIIMGECIRLKLNYGIPSKTLVKPENKQSGYFPDVLLLNRSNLVNEPRWKKESIITLPESIALVVEVVSTNWRDDYYRKLADYEEMGIREYWIVDYRPFGSKLLIGNPKEPIITVYSFNDENEYQDKHFKGNDRIESATFPELNLTAQQIFAAHVY